MESSPSSVMRERSGFWRVRMPLLLLALLVAAVVLALGHGSALVRGEHEGVEVASAVPGESAAAATELPSSDTPMPGPSDAPLPPGAGDHDFPQPTVRISPPPPCTEDSFEDNDRLETAWPVALPFSQTALRVCPPDDDLFAFPLSQGETVQVDTLFAHADGNIDVVLHDTAGLPVAVAASVTDNETMTYTCCSPAGAGTHTVGVFLSQRGSGLPSGNSYDVDISTLQPTPCGPEGCLTPTTTPTPFSSLDFSIGIDADGDTTDDCGTRPGEPAECSLPLASMLTMKIYLNGLPPGVPSYEGFDLLLRYSGVSSEGNSDTRTWPGCVFPATFYDSGRIALGCAAVHPSAYVGMIGSSDFSCPSTPTSGAITMVHGPGHTALVEGVEPVGAVHHEGIETTEALSINCVEQEPAPTHIPTLIPPPAPSRSGEGSDGASGGNGRGALAAMLGALTLGSAGPIPDPRDRAGSPVL